MDKMWALTVHMTYNWNDFLEEKVQFAFDDAVWEDVLEAAVDAGINTIVFDLLDGICYGSHPEIAVDGAWSRERMRKEIKRLRKLGIKAIPRLNLSADHSLWLGEYARMISTKEYYRVCHDLIFEVSELFEQPSHINLAMDEEDTKHLQNNRVNIIRTGKAMWNDLQFLFDCVRDVGATPWICHDLLFNNTEEFVQFFSSENVLIGPWYYAAMYKEHYMPITARQVLMDYYAQDQYKDYEIKYLEDDPWCVNFREKVLPCAKYGYHYMPSLSFINRSAYCFEDAIKFYKSNLSAEQLEGFIVSAFHIMTPDHKQAFLNNIYLMGQAKKLYSGEISSINIEQVAGYLNK